VNGRFRGILAATALGLVWPSFPALTERPPVAHAGGERRPGTSTAHCVAEPIEAVSISLRAASDDPLDLSSADVVELVVENRRSEAGSAVISAVEFTQHGWRSIASVAELPLEPESAAVVAVPLAAIQPTSQPLDFSGRLRFDVRVDFAEGTFAASPEPAVAWFHPSGSRWLVYGDGSRSESFSGGVLTVLGESLREVCVAAAGADPATVVGSLAGARKVSDGTDWLPEEDAPDEL
ncbi:MAG: hypothetical protein ACREQ9_14505, partial [Candidatus Binatia bacterium]